MNSPQLIEADHSSLLLTWEESPSKPAQFELQITEHPIDSDLDANNYEWKTLSDNIHSTSIKKKNLSAMMTYMFRIRYFDHKTSHWIEFSSPSAAMSVINPDTMQLDPPTLVAKDGLSITIAWKECAESHGYEIRYREDVMSSNININIIWHYIDTTIMNTTVRKKGLKAGINYYFSVRPVATGADVYEYSPSSAAMSVAVASVFMTQILPSLLMSQTGMTRLNDAVAGMVVAIYFSAHWCGPCRQFTPVLVAAYQQAKAAGKAFEVIFCSADRGEKEFEEYYREMPWLAISFHDEQREMLMARFQVNGIPKLSILAPNGRVVVDNAAGQRISMDMIDSWIATAAQM